MKREGGPGSGGSPLGPAVRSAAGLRYEAVRVLLSLPDPVLHTWERSRRLHVSGCTPVSAHTGSAAASASS